MPVVNVILKKKDGVYEVGVAPHRVYVPLGFQTITWRAVGDSNSVFPENPVTWKLGGPTTVSPARSDDGKTFTLAYDNQVGGYWVYGIRISDGAVTIDIDPEVDNERPPGGDDEEGPGKPVKPVKP